MINRQIVIWPSNTVPAALRQIKISTAGGLYTDVGDHESIAITKDLFLLVIQDGLCFLAADML